MEHSYYIQMTVYPHMGEFLIRSDSLGYDVFQYSNEILVDHRMIVVDDIDNDIPLLRFPYFVLGDMLRGIKMINRINQYND